MRPTHLRCQTPRSLVFPALASAEPLEFLGYPRGYCRPKMLGSNVINRGR